MNDKIKAALLGDAAAAAECTAAGIAIPCPFCGEARGVAVGYCGAVFCPECDATRGELSDWNRRVPVQTENAEKDRELKAYEIAMKMVTAQRDEASYRMKAAEAALTCAEAERDAAVQCMRNIKQALTGGELVLDSLHGAQEEA